MLYVVLSIVRDGAMFWGSLRASRRLYRKLIKAILSAKPQFFDRTPVGRIMNRYVLARTFWGCSFRVLTFLTRLCSRLSKDQETVDQDIAPGLLFLCDCVLSSLAVLAVIIYATPAFAFAAIFIIILYFVIGALYIVSSRDLKRIESVQRSPIYTLTGEVLGGAVIIRAYGDAARFTRHCLRLVDKANRPFFFL